MKNKIHKENIKQKLSESRFFSYVKGILCVKPNKQTVLIFLLVFFAKRKEFLVDANVEENKNRTQANEINTKFNIKFLLFNMKFFAHSRTCGCPHVFVLIIIFCSIGVRQQPSTSENTDGHSNLPVNRYGIQYYEVCAPMEIYVWTTANERIKTKSLGNSSCSTEFSITFLLMHNKAYTVGLERRSSVCYKELPVRPTALSMISLWAISLSFSIHSMLDSPCIY